MGSLSWLRVATRAVGLSGQPEFKNLEALLEAEEGQPHNDFRVLAKVVPSIVAGAGLLLGCYGIFARIPQVFWGALAVAAIAAPVWILFDRMDKSIRPAKARIRQLSEQIWDRYRRFSNLAGVEPALAHSVGEVLDEAAAIYLKHSTIDAAQRKLLSEPQVRSINALEEAMARMLDLAMPQTVRSQELELGAGWARPLLQEMKDLDRALDQYKQGSLAPRSDGSVDPLAALREARLELQSIETAVSELEQRH